MAMCGEFFNARVENMRAPTNAATNHRVLNAGRARWMYNRLQSLASLEISSITLTLMATRRKLLEKLK